MRVSLSPVILAMAAMLCLFLPGAAVGAPTYSPLMGGGEHMGKLIGGAGGGQFIARCPAGESYLAGIEVTTDERISTIKLICATRQLNQLVSPARFGNDIGTAKFSRTSAACPGGGAINGITVFADGESGGIMGVWQIDLRCSDAHGVLPIGEPSYLRFIGSQQLSGLTTSVKQSNDQDECPAGYIAKGLWGHSGLFIDEIGLICDWIEADPTPPPPPPKPIHVTGRAPGQTATSNPWPTSLFTGDWTVTSAVMGTFDLQMLQVTVPNIGAVGKNGAKVDEIDGRALRHDTNHATLTFSQAGRGRTGNVDITISADGNSFVAFGSLSTGEALTWNGVRKPPTPPPAPPSSSTPPQPH